MKGLLVAVLLAAVCVINAQDCGECGECEAPVGCVAGFYKDKCGCCDICAKAQYELCDHPNVHTRRHLGHCGHNLECRLRNDLLTEDEPEAICFCRSEKEVCGSDDMTYENICDLAAAGVLKGENIIVKSTGPCKSTPTIITPPEHAKNKTGSEIALSCEAKGFPIPVIEWTWTRVDGRSVFLPSDDLHISVNMRGGPDKWQVTGWLQIIDVKKDHEGDYTCIAQNEFGSVQATARVNVVGKKDSLKRRQDRNSSQRDL